MKISSTIIINAITYLAVMTPLVAADDSKAANSKYVEKTSEEGRVTSIGGASVALQGGGSTYKVDPADKDAVTAGPGQRIFFNGNPKMIVPANKYAVIKGAEDIVLKDEVQK